MNRQEMLERLEAGEEPIDVSIKKWKDVVKHIEAGKQLADINTGVATCALCEKFWNTELEENWCEDCSYFQHYGYKCFENGTAYDNFYFERIRHNRSKALVAAKEMVKELEEVKKWLESQ